MLEQLELLELSLEQLQAIRKSLTGRIREGLAAEGREIKALPTYLPVPDASLAGTAMVVDAGGTNMRAALIELKGNGRVDVLGGPIGERIPDGRGDERVTAAQFFGAQAELMCRLSPPSGLPVGYCFSYPAETLPSRDARLLRWTKGIDIPGVEGTMVGAQLKDALSQCNLSPGRVVVMNDTVASLMGGRVLYPHLDYDERYIGLIVGTGTNMAALIPADEITKIEAESWGGREMLVNLESGNFTPPHLTPWDDAVDRKTDHPGLQRFEKAVSGYYLPFLFQEVCPGVPGFEPEKGTRQLVELRDESHPNEEARRTADLLLKRSADLVAAALTAVSDLYPPRDFGILAEGSLIFGDPRYASRVESTIDRLVDGKRAGHIIQQRENVNLIGAASAALLVD